MSKAFWLLNVDTGSVESTLSSNTPREAALKAATRNVKQICLVEASVGKVHFFEGERVPLSENEVSDYTEQRNIQSKPIVKKTGYKKVASKISTSEIGDLAQMLRDDYLA